MTIARENRRRRAKRRKNNERWSKRRAERGLWLQAWESEMNAWIDVDPMAAMGAMLRGAFGDLEPLQRIVAARP